MLRPTAQQEMAFRCLQLALQDRRTEPDDATMGRASTFLDFVLGERPDPDTAEPDGNRR